MSAYLVPVLCTVFAAFALFFILNKKSSGRPGAVAAAVSLPLCAALGFLFAKLFYVILVEIGSIVVWGEWDALFSMDPSTFCFTGGAIGIWAGLLLSARITDLRPAGRLLDRFVLPGTLLIAGLRIAEKELDLLGAGRFIDAPEGSFPLLPAVYNEYGEPYLAVFALEAAAALVIGLFSLFKKEDRPGQHFETAVFRLCVCQILLENLRSQALSWGFVLVEQLLCAVLLMILMLLACCRNTKKQGAVRFLPAVYLLLCIAAIVGIEFLRQRSPSRFMGLYGGYLMMAAVLCVILLLYRSLIKGRHPLPHREYPARNQ